MGHGFKRLSVSFLKQLPSNLLVAGSIPAGGTNYFRSKLTIVTTKPDSSAHAYVAFIRGINVGGNSTVPMATLRHVLTEAGFSEVSTLLNSGNVVLRSTLKAPDVAQGIEGVPRNNFELSPNAGRTHVLTAHQLDAAITSAPENFGKQPELFHSDIIFLMGVEAEEASAAFTPKEGVDTIWLGDGVIYSQRLSAERTKSRLNRVMQHPIYKSMTIRTWNTALKLNAAASALNQQ